MIKNFDTIFNNYCLTFKPTKGCLVPEKISFVSLTIIKQNSLSVHEKKKMYFFHTETTFFTFFFLISSSEWIYFLNDALLQCKVVLLFLKSKFIYE